MVYAVYTTERFDREIETLSDFDKEIIKKAITKLKDNIYATFFILPNLRSFKLSLN
jgi:mRNA-degrading endonuclease RelE of RelBE toxin-antitoxin system